MWCTNCQQDVPGIAHAVSGRLVCSRCQRAAPTRKRIDAARICDEGIALDEPAAAMAAAAPPLRVEDWSSRQRVRDLSRELRRTSFAPTTASHQIPHGRHRFAPPQDLFDALKQTTTPTMAPIPPQHTADLLRLRRAEGSQVMAWLVVVLGVVGLIAGVGLIAWTLATKQMIYWNLALGLSLGSEGMLVLGLVLVVSRLWRSSRYAAGKLQDVHARLGQLQQTAEALAATRSVSAPAFYADLARGASPQVLVANLKGQVDQLATQLSSRW